MSRGLTGFLLFLGLVVIGIAGAAAYLGPNGLTFVLHGERKTAPFVMVDLLDFASDADYQRYQSDYVAPALAIARSVGGRLVWQARLTDTVAGNATDRWPYIVFTEYPSRAAFIDMVTSAEYRALVPARDAALARSVMMAATPDGPMEEGVEYLAFRLLQESDDGAHARYAQQWWDEDLALLAVNDGRAAFRASLNPLVADEDHQFGALYVFAFPTEAARQAWVDDPERSTLRALEQRLFARDVLLLGYVF